MTAQDCPGSNDDPTIAAQMRSFKVPKQMTSPDARGLTEQAMVVFAALVGEEYTIIILDHERLCKLHIMSLSRPWTQSDLESTLR